LDDLLRWKKTKEYPGIKLLQRPASVCFLTSKVFILTAMLECVTGYPGASGGIVK
jgi:hypothetical protein